MWGAEFGHGRFLYSRSGSCPACPWVLTYPSSQLLDAIFGQQFDDVVANQYPTLKAAYTHLAMDVFRHVRDDALLALAELLRGRLRALLASLLARLLEAQTHSSCLSTCARGAVCRRPPPRSMTTCAPTRRATRHPGTRSLGAPRRRAR